MLNTKCDESVDLDRDRFETVRDFNVLSMILNRSYRSGEKILEELTERRYGIRPSALAELLQEMTKDKLLQVRPPCGISGAVTTLLCMEPLQLEYRLTRLGVLERVALKAKLPTLVPSPSADV